jgi:uncharacterized protein YqgV (UPF0045/DUF77 family)
MLKPPQYRGERKRAYTVINIDERRDAGGRSAENMVRSVREGS